MTARPSPWAVDATGAAVPTWFEIDGTSLYQVVQHVGGNFSYGIVADPWWNPFSWPWGKWVKKSAKAVRGALTKCGAGALKSTLKLAGMTGSMNIMLKHAAGKAMVMVPGGQWGYVTVAVAGCIEKNL